MSVRQQQKDLTRSRIIEAALEVFDRDGYATARVEDVAAGAGVSRATFYLHFRSKIDVVTAMGDPLRRDSQALYRELDALAEPTWPALRAWLEVAVDFWWRHGRAVNIINQALASEPELTPQFVDAVRLSVDVMTNHLARWSGAEREAAHLRAMLFILQFERFSFVWIVRGTPYDTEAVLDALADSLWTALHPGAVPRVPR